MYTFDAGAVTVRVNGKFFMRSGVIKNNHGPTVGGVVIDLSGKMYVSGDAYVMDNDCDGGLKRNVYVFAKAFPTWGEGGGVADG